MPAAQRTWWSQRFIDALERSTDRGRLQRGRAYASPRRILAFGFDGATVHATVRGNKNPYFGVYTEPKYDTRVGLKPIPQEEWAELVGRIAANAGWLTRLLMGEVPDDIEQAFEGSGHHLLPRQSKDLVTNCSCPDWANPCKHVAGVLYHLAGELDHDPFLLFRLRGLEPAELRRQLATTPLGRALAGQLEAEAALVPEPQASRYPQPAAEPADPAMDLKAFWHGGDLPEPAGRAAPPPVPGLLIRKQGDNPPFWGRDGSFIGAMVEIYETVRRKSGDGV